MFKKTNSHECHYIDEENPYWISFSDILSGLLVIFILASIQLVIQLFSLQEELDKRKQDVEETIKDLTKENQVRTQLLDEIKWELEKRKKNVEKAIKDLAKANQVRTQLLDEIKWELEKRNIMVEVSDNKSVLRIPEEQLHFRSGRHQIPSAKLELIAVIGEVLLKTITKAERYRFLDTIFVEGHTDSQPAPNLEMGNWELSAKRSISVWKFWTEQNSTSKALKNLHNFRGQILFSVSGYADTRRLIEEDNTPETRQRNRRIDLRFTVRQPTIVDLEEIKDAF